MPGSPRLGVPGMASLFGLAFAVFGLRAGLGRLSDNSFLWHFRTGQWIVDHGRVPYDDLYSFTVPDQDWVSQSWLAETIYGLLDQLMGPWGVRFLSGLTGAAVAAGVFGIALRFARDRVRAALLTAAALGGSFTLWSERPLFLGLLSFVALVWVVEAPASGLGRRPMVSLPVFLWLWANMHGSFALGFAYLGLHVLGRWLEGAPPWAGRERQLVVGALIAFAALFANPYGVELVTFPIHLLGRGDILERVVEWRSPDFRSLTGMCFAAWIAVFVFCLARGRNRPGRRDVLVSLPFLLLALWAQRNIALVPLVGVPVAARAVAADARPDVVVARVNVAVTALLAVMGLAWVVEAATEGDFDLRRYPVEAMEEVEGRGWLGRRLLTTDAWGGYVIAAYWPEQRVFFDDRYDMYPVSLTEDYLDFANLRPGWERLLDRYDIEVVVWDRDSAVAGALGRLDGWRPAYRDDVAVVYRRDAT
ncbi:MAG: hypothetical protein ACRDY7_15490 [Acidimicrobiia bacterium]